MDEKKFAELIQDKTFMDKIMKATTPEEVKGFFKEHGMEITDNDINSLAQAIAKVAQNEGKLSEKDLESVSGGVESKSDLAAGMAIGAGIMVVPAIVAAGYAFKKGYDYSNSWWEYVNEKLGKTPSTK